MRDLLGGLWGSVVVQPPPMQEQLTILSQMHPLLVPLLPSALATLTTIRQAAGQATMDMTSSGVCFTPTTHLAILANLVSI